MVTLNLSLPPKTSVVQWLRCKRGSGLLSSSINLASVGVGQLFAWGRIIRSGSLGIPHSATCISGTLRSERTLRSTEDTQLLLSAPLEVEGMTWDFSPLAQGLQNKKLSLRSCWSYKTRIFSSSHKGGGLLRFSARGLLQDMRTHNAGKMNVLYSTM